MEEMISDELRKWAMRKPRPHVVRLTCSDGEARRCVVPSGRIRWRDLANEWAGFRPVTAEALNGDGDNIRTLHFQEGDEGEPIPAESVQAAHRPRTPFPEVPAALHEDAETARMLFVYQLFHQSTESVREAYQHATGVAFDRMVEVFNIVMQRMDHLENKLEKTEDDYRAEARRNVEQWRDENPNGSMEEMMKEFFGGFAKGKKAQSSNGKRDEWGDS